MTSTLTDISTLVIEECYRCGIRFAMPQNLRNQCLRDHSHSFYCPNGHGQVFAGETDAQKLSRQLKQERINSGWYRDQMEASERSKAAIKGHLTRARNKLAKGQCPCCDQIFGNVREHMRHKHPDYHLTDIETAAAQDQENPFPLIGEHFETRDPRDEGRVIRLTGFATDNGYEVPGRYRYVVIASPLNPSRVDKVGEISTKTLSRWKKVSR